MIKNIFNPGNNTNNVSYMLLVLRLVVGVLMLTHGMSKFHNLFGDEPIQFPDPIGVGVTASLALTVFAEVLCSILLIFGVGTRLAALSLLFTMLVVVFIVHSNDGFARQELPLLYAAIYMVIAVTGAGRISIDSLIYKKLDK